MRSTAGSVGIPVGDGVMNSPSSAFTSATMPANGARRMVLAIAAAITSMRAPAASAVLRAATQPAAAALASVPERSSRSSDTKPRRCRSAWRPASRRATSARWQASSPRARALACSTRVWASWASRSSCQISSSTAPAATRLPSVTLRVLTCPPALGARCARRHGLMVPARVLATLAATGPVPASATRTCGGSGRRRYHTPTIRAARSAIRSTQRTVPAMIHFPLPC